MILVSNGLGMSFLHHVKDAKFLLKSIESSSRKNFYARTNDEIYKLEPFKDQVILWDYHIGEEREPIPVPDPLPASTDGSVTVEAKPEKVIVKTGVKKDRPQPVAQNPVGGEDERVALEAFYADEWAYKGYMVVNGFRVGHLIEEHREASLQVMESLRIPIPPTLYAHSFDEAIDLIENSGFGKLVIKPSGKFPSWTTNICDTESEAVEFLDTNQDIFRSANNICIQKFIDGVEMSCEVWVGKYGAIAETLNFTLETKKFLSGNLGLTTGCEYLLTWFPSKRNKITKYVMDFGNWLHKQGFVGCVDLNFIIDQHGDAHALECTPRCGYDAHYVLFGMIEKYVGLERFMKALYSEKTFPPIPKDIYGFGVRISVPPYPLELKQAEEIFDEYFDEQVVKVDTEFMEGSVDFIPDGIDPSTNEVINMYVGVVYAISGIWKEAIENVYTFAKKGIKLLNKQYRNDGMQNIGERLSMLKYLKIL